VAAPAAAAGAAAAVGGTEHPEKTFELESRADDDAFRERKGS
jgi:hypothetical protein